MVKPAVWPASVPGGFPGAGGWSRALGLRPLTGRDEAEVFGPGSRRPATLATLLLARCAYLEGEEESAGPEFVRRLSVGDREALLLQLRSITLGEALPCVLVCAECGEKMELTLRAKTLLLDPYPREGKAHSLAVNCGPDLNMELVFRLPNGGDQEAVAPLAEARPNEAVRVMARRCVLSVNGRSRASMDDLPDDAFSLLSERMAELDPQAEIWIRLTCPQCGEEAHTLFDSMHYLNREMEWARARLDADLHLLARHYHWAESDILDMPGARRRRYADYLRGVLQEERTP